MDLSPLMSSREESPPSGENLEYDMDFISLELTAAPGEERQEGDTIHAAEDPAWPEVQEKALVVLGRAHDLRAAGYLAQAALGTEGIAGFAEVLRYIRTCLEEFWDTVHPQLDPEDDNDPTARINALRLLADNGMMLRLLRLAPLSESRGFGALSLRDLHYASGELTPPAGTDAPDEAAVAAAFRDTDPQVLAARGAALAQAVEHVRGIDKVFAEHLPGDGPDLDPLLRVLHQMQKALAPYLQSDAGADEGGAEADGAEAGEAGGGGEAPARGRGASGEIASNRDVTAALDRILSYYERHEPSSPVPLILKRARRLVGADFMAIMRDMAPAGVSEVTVISGAGDNGGGGGGSDY